MSWKITKKLKDTHLAPLGNPFSRSSSTSTITPSDNSESKNSSETSDTPSLTDSTSTGASSIADPNGIITTTEHATPAPRPPKPGTLTVTIHEAKGLTLSEDAKRTLAGPMDSNGAGHMSRNSDSFSYAGSQGGWSIGGRPKTIGGAGLGGLPTNHGRFLEEYQPYVLLEFEKMEVMARAQKQTGESIFWHEKTTYKFDVSRKADVAFSLFIPYPHAPRSEGRSRDIFLGTCRVAPKFEESDVTYADPNDKSQGFSGVDWVPVQYGSGQLKIGISFHENKSHSLNMEDFEILKVIGKGSFGKVMQVRKNDNKMIYAMKTIRKAHIISRSEVSHTLAERSVLAQINHPFIVPLKFSFQTPDKLILVLAFVNGGELFHHLQREHRFELNRARFYAAELLCALECLHGFNVIYRDLKPENILLDYSGHIALCDFGLCKLDMKDEDRTNTFCGTPEYLAPELLHGSGYTKTVDWWTLGVLLYEMLTGLPPFYDENTNEMYRKILTEPLHFPSDQKIMPPAARDLLTKLLDRRPDKRLGSNGSAEIKSHPFFSGIDWRKLLQRRYEPTFKPSVKDQTDTSNFDSEFTSEMPQDSFVEGPMLSQTAQQQFVGWSYNRPVAGLNDAGGSVKDPAFGSVHSAR